VCSAFDAAFAKLLWPLVIIIITKFIQRTISSKLEIEALIVVQVTWLALEASPVRVLVVALILRFR